MVELKHHHVVSRLQLRQRVLLALETGPEGGGGEMDRTKSLELC